MYRNVHRGFTLVELMVVMALVAILVTVAIPGFNNTIRENRLITSTQTLMTSLALARSEAVRRGRAVSMCPSSTGNSCDPSASFAEGWVVFTDTGTPGSIDGTDEVLRSQAALPSSLQIQVTGDKYVHYESRGMLAGACEQEDCAPTSLAMMSDDDLANLQRPWSGAVWTALSLGDAVAGRGGNGGNGGKTDSDNGSDFTGPGSIIQICDDRTGETGVSITIRAGGRASTDRITCS